MVLYNGSNVVVKIPKLIKTDKGRDFGVAFYVTPIKEQAERQAVRKFKQEHVGKPVVSVFKWDEDISTLKVKNYDKPDLEWLEMIIKCRSDVNYVHGYDLLIGKIADDSVGVTILYVISGVMRKEDAIERLKFQKINSQYAFCSIASLGGLSFDSSYEVK